jgi:Zn-dependent peptidase ImmA (M78 family)/transcriptional regulator with XRE-family HTH domain
MHLMEPEVGARIRRLREAAGLRAHDLASRVGLDATAMSKIENGRRGVKSTELARLAEALNVSPLALLEDDPLLTNFPLAARRAGSSIASGGAYERLLSLTELHVVLADAGIPTSPALAPVPPVIGRDWLESANVLSEWALDRLRLEPSGDQRLAQMADLIENQLKIDVLMESFPGDPLSGAAIIDMAFPLLFVNSDHSRPRSLFTLAHELGHLLARRADDEIALDREMGGSTDTEKLANAFAAAYLLPESEVRQTLNDEGRSMSTLVRLTDSYGVSYETLIYRLHNLRLIDAAGRDRLIAISWQQLVDRSVPSLIQSGYAPSRIGKLFARGQQKPAGRPPALLVQRAFDGYRKGVLSVRPLAGLLHVDPAELMRQLPADGGDLAEYDDLNRTSLEGDAADEPTEELFSGSPV